MKKLKTKVPLYYYDYDPITDSYSIWKNTNNELALIGFKSKIEEVMEIQGHKEDLAGRNHLKISKIDEKLKNE